MIIVFFPVECCTFTLYRRYYCYKYQVSDLRFGRVFKNCNNAKIQCNLAKPTESEMKCVIDPLRTTKTLSTKSQVQLESSTADAGT